MIFSCHNNKKKDSHRETILTKTDTPAKEQPNFKTVEQMEQYRQRLLDSNYSFLDKMLDTVLKAANQKTQEHSFSGKIDTALFGYKDMYATYEFGNIFSNDKKHLLVKRFINEYSTYSGSLYSDIYLLRNNSFEKVAADTVTETFEENFEDLNCDGFRDYVVNSYSGAGCCPRSADNGYLYKRKSGDFVFVDFFNRESNCPDKVFYETSYGYNYDIEVYKYKWVGMKKVLLESFGPTFISWDLNKNPKTYTKIIYPSGKKLILKNAPAEYRKLKIFDYFEIK
jgi:hypothetical protein